jgi:hypothetical protein
MQSALRREGQRLLWFAEKSRNELYQPPAPTARPPTNGARCVDPPDGPCFMFGARDVADAPEGLCFAAASWTFDGMDIQQF